MVGREREGEGLLVDFACVYCVRRGTEAVNNVYIRMCSFIHSICEKGPRFIRRRGVMRSKHKRENRNLKIEDPGSCFLSSNSRVNAEAQRQQ